MTAAPTRAAHGDRATRRGEGKTQRGPAPEAAECGGCSADRLGNAGLQRLLASGRVRARLRVGSASDPAESEADAAAARVVSGGTASVSGASPPDDDGGCDACARRDADGPAPTAPSAARAADGMRDGGQALAARERGWLERGFGRDLGDVRLHTGASAARAADELSAHAWTLGSDIVFGAGEYAPHMDSGRRLLAHEVAHVVQGGDAVRRQETGDGGVSEVAECREEPVFGPQLEPAQCSAPEAPTEEPVCRAAPPRGAWTPPTVGPEIVEFRGWTLSPDAEYLRYVLAQMVAQYDFEPSDRYIADLDGFLNGVPSGAYDANGRPEADPTTSAQGYGRLLRIVPMMQEEIELLRSGYHDFTSLVLNGSIVRLRANHRNLGLWEDYVATLGPTHVMAQAAAADEYQRMTMYSGTHSRVPENPIDIYERRTHEHSPYMRDYYDALVDGRINCGGQQCHSLRYAHEMSDRHPAIEFGELGLSPLERMRGFEQAELDDPSPAPPVGLSADPFHVPSHMRGLIGQRPGATAMADMIDRMRTRLVPLGDAGYRVIPDGVMNSLTSPQELMSEVLGHIATRRQAYLRLIGRIESGDASYLEFQELLQQLLPTADPLVQMLVRGAIDRKQREEEDAGFLEGLLTVAALLLTIFPPTAPLGLAMDVGLGIHGLYQGYEQYEQGVRFEEGIGAGIYTREQEDSARTMQAMGIFTMVVSEIGIGMAGFEAVALVREAGAGSRIARVEAESAGRRIEIAGIESENPVVTITEADGTVRTTSVSELHTEMEGMGEGATTAARGGEHLSEAERGALERNRLVDSDHLPPERAGDELDVVTRREGSQLPEGGEYVEEVPLENGHVWRRRADGVWCRFSDNPVCFLVNPSRGAAEARRLGLPEPPEGYHWAMGPDGAPFVRRNPTHEGLTLRYDPETRSFPEGARGAVDTSHLPDVSGGYHFEEPYVDSGGSTIRQAEGDLGVPGQVRRHRDVSAQRGVSRGTGDDAGHYFGDRFGAPGGPENLSRQNWIANEYGTYSDLEDYWESRLQQGTRVHVEVTETTVPGGVRPRDRVVRWTETAGDGSAVERQLNFVNFETPESRAAAGYTPPVGQGEAEIIDLASRRGGG